MTCSFESRGDSLLPRQCIMYIRRVANAHEKGHGSIGESSCVFRALTPTWQVDRGPPNTRTFLSCLLYSLSLSLSLSVSPSKELSFSSSLISILFFIIHFYFFFIFYYFFFLACKSCVSTNCHVCTRRTNVTLLYFCST